MAEYCLHASGEIISLGPPIGHGGEADICVVQRRSDLLAKIYKSPQPDVDDKLTAMIDTPPTCLSLGGGYAELIWPLDIIRDADAGYACVGCTMGYVRNRLSLEIISNPATCPPEIDIACKLRIAANVAWMVSKLHDSNIVVGDLHPGNILANAAGCVSFIDTDSYQFSCQGRVYRCGFAKYGYVPHELLNVASETHLTAHRNTMHSHWRSARFNY